MDKLSNSSCVIVSFNDSMKNFYQAGKEVINLAAIVVPQARAASFVLDVGEFTYELSTGKTKDAIISGSTIAATELVDKSLSINPKFKFLSDAGRKKLAEAVVETLKYTVSKGGGYVKDNYGTGK